MFETRMKALCLIVIIKEEEYLDFEDLPLISFGLTVNPELKKLLSIYESSSRKIFCELI